MHWLLIGYMWLFIHRPFEVWPVLGEFRLEFLYMLLTGAVWIVYPNKRFTGNPLHLALLLFAGAVLLCGLLSPWTSACLAVLDNYWKILVFYLLLTTTVHDEQALKRIMLAFGVIMTLYMLHSFWEFQLGRHVSRMGIRRMVGVDSSRGDPNAFAASILLSLAFVPAVWTGWPSLRVRLFLCLWFGLGTTCILLTGSRGTLVAMLAWGFLAIVTSRLRWKLAPVALLCLPLAWLALPDSLQNRFLTIVDSSAGPANARTSGEARLHGLTIGFQLWQQHPISGVGPGAWRPATGRPLEAHNLYGQLMGETGTLGVVTFGLVLIAIWINLRRIRAAYALDPDRHKQFLFQMGRCSGMAILLLLLTGNFGHNLFRYNWVWFGAFLVIAAGCAAGRRTSVAWVRPVPCRLNLAYGVQ